jgi:hypothetical protein
MAARDADKIPIGLRRVCRRFERWRSEHRSRLPIPGPLWRAAVEAAREHGVFRAAKTLRLDYGKLKRMMETTAIPPRLTMAPAKFVELTPSEGIAVAECVIELEGPHGKMRIHWKGALPPDLAGLSRVLWESA